MKQEKTSIVLPEGSDLGAWARCSECIQPGPPSSLSLYRENAQFSDKAAQFLDKAHRRRGYVPPGWQSILLCCSLFTCFHAQPTAQPLGVRNLGRSRECLSARLSLSGTEPFTERGCHHGPGAAPGLAARILPAEGPGSQHREWRADRWAGLACRLLLCDLQAKNDSATYKWLKNLKRIIFCDM